MKEASLGHVTVEACKLIIEKLGVYSQQLEEFDKQTYASLDELNQTHRDQNFQDFVDQFTPLWDQIKPFKEKVDSFQAHIEKNILPRVERYDDTKAKL